MRKNDSNLSSKLLTEFDRFIKITKTDPTAPSIKTPLSEFRNDQLKSKDKKNIQGLMRINHTGEVCAQALYFGQAMFAKDKSTHKHLIQAASEEHNHLYWCYERLKDLNAKSSILNPLWYLGSFSLGTIAGLFGDKISYGFVIEVEKQVEDHLQDHIEQIPESDKKTHAILSKMKEDEIRHGQDARIAGGIDLPIPIKSTMQLMSNFMKFLVYRV